MLKRRHCCASIIAVAGLLGSVSAQDNKDKQPEKQPSGEQTKVTTKTEKEVKRTSEYDDKQCTLVPASRAEGVSVLGNDDVKLGTIKDAIVRGSSGRVVYVLVSRGSEPSYDRVVPVPYAALSWDHERNSLRLPVTEEQFKAAASFETNQWNQLADPLRATPVYTYFKVADDRANEDRKVYRVTRTTETRKSETDTNRKETIETRKETTETRKEKTETRKPDETDKHATKKDIDEPALKRIDAEGSLVRVGDIRNRPVLNRDGHTMGLINDVVFDAPSGRVAFLVVTPDASLNAGDGRIGVPWPLFEVDANGRLFSHELDADTLRATPRLTQDDWAELRINNYTEDMYTRYGYDAGKWNEVTWKTDRSGDQVVTRTKETKTTEVKDTDWQNRYRTAMASGTPRTIRGKIESVEEYTFKDGSSNVTVINVKTDEGETVKIHTAPRTFLDRLGLGLNQGDTVAVVGKNADIEGKKCVCATEVTPSNGKRVVLYTVDSK